MTSHLNGSGPNGSGNVSSLDEARRRAAERAKAEKRAKREAKRGGPMTLRDWLVGGALVLMALGMVWHLVAPLAGVKGLVR